MKTLVIGDIHGCAGPLNDLLAKITAHVDTIVFLGDYVDRGPDSKKVVDTVLDLQRQHGRVIPLMGNHDFMFLSYLTKQGNQDLFLHVGGHETLKSYGITQEADHDPASAIPPDHLAFFNSLPLYWEDHHGIYVHAGLQPGRHLSQQKAQWCLWARNNFISTTFNFGKPVIFGHTTFSTPRVDDNKIGIDTGAVYGGKLTGLLLPDMEFISVPGEKQHPYPLHA